MKYLNELLEYDEKKGIKHSKAILRAFEKHKRIHQRALDGIYKYDAEKVEKAIAFVENEFYLTTGELKLIKLHPVQKWWFELIFGYYTTDGDILINEIFLNIIRGAGKSTILAALEMTWALFGNNYGGESWIIAYDNNQAEHVFGQVRNQISSGNGVLKKLGDSNLLKTTKTGIDFVPLKNTIRKATHDISRLQGNNTSLNAFDEVHTYKEDVVSAVNKGSRQKQKSWRSIYITSGGITRGYLYDDMIKRFTSDDEYESDRSIGLIYQLDSAIEVKDESNWTKAAPMMMDGLPSLESVREEYNIAKGDNALQLQFLAYNMGVAVNDSAKYIMPNESKRTEYDFDAVWTNADVVLGVDLSITGDLTALIFLTEKDGITYAHCEAIGSRNFFNPLPEHIVSRLTGIPNLTLTDNAFISSHDVLRVAREFIDKYNCSPLFVGYDPARYDNLKVLIEENFFDVDGERQLPIRQGFAMSDYIKLMKEKLSEHSLIHNSEILEWSLNNFAVKVGSRGDYMATKLIDAEKIDPVVALVIAIETMVIKGI
jgi:phage terminase